MKTTEGNKLIDAFMIVCSMEDKPLNYKHSSSFGKNYFKGLKYHSSWDWLIPVVENIYNLNYDVNISTGGYCQVRNFENDVKNYDYEGNGKSMIDATWQAVIKFIEWYNTQNK